MWPPETPLILDLSTYNSKTSSMTCIFYNQIVVSMIRCNFLQRLKKSVKGVQKERSHCCYGNLLCYKIDSKMYMDEVSRFWYHDCNIDWNRVVIPVCYHFRCFGETLSTLNFAKRAKMIKNKVCVSVLFRVCTHLIWILTHFKPLLKFQWLLGCGEWRCYRKHYCSSSWNKKTQRGIGESQRWESLAFVIVYLSYSIPVMATNIALLNIVVLFSLLFQ